MLENIQAKERLLIQENSERGFSTRMLENIQAKERLLLQENSERGFSTRVARKNPGQRTPFASRELREGVLYTNAENIHSKERLLL
jgi:hypothetical protein